MDKPHVKNYIAISAFFCVIIALISFYSGLNSLNQERNDSLESAIKLENLNQRALKKANQIYFEKAMRLVLEEEAAKQEAALLTAGN